MIKLTDLLSSSSQLPILLDGGLGSMMEDCGINVKTPLWGSYAMLTEEGRQINRDVHQNYADAGANIILTNTHNALLDNCRKFLLSGDIDYNYTRIDAKLNIEKQAVELHRIIIQSAVEDANKVRPSKSQILIANCIGSIDQPYAKIGVVSTLDAAQIFETELQTRLEISKDLIIFETLTTSEEVEGLSTALWKTGLDNFAIGLTCGADGKTFGGVSLSDAVNKLAPFNPQVFFIQCTHFEYVDKALTKLSEAVGNSFPIGVYANDGRGWDNGKMEWVGKRVTPAAYAEKALGWHDAGADIIGGCCGTHPAHIKELRKVFS